MMKESAFCHSVVGTISAVSSLNNVDQEILFGSKSSSNLIGRPSFAGLWQGLHVD